MVFVYGSQIVSSSSYLTDYNWCFFIQSSFGHFDVQTVAAVNTWIQMSTQFFFLKKFELNDWWLIHEETERWN